MKANRYHDYLRQVPLFETLTPSELDVVGGAVTDLNLAAGTVLMREGSMAHEMLIIIEGTVEVTHEGAHVADVGPGGFVGEMALLNHRERNSTVTTTTPIEALHIDGRRLNTLLQDVPAIALKMLPIVASRMGAEHDSHTH